MTIATKKFSATIIAVALIASAFPVFAAPSPREHNDPGETLRAAWSGLLAFITPPEYGVNTPE